MAREAEVITIDSDDETPRPSTSAGMPSRQAVSSQSTSQTPRTNGAPAAPASKSSNQPFYLFCRENKKYVSAKYGNLDIEAMKWKYVELWRALPEAEKSKYKKRVSSMAQPATKIAKANMPPLLDSRHQPRRSAVTGFMVFSMEFKKTLPPSATPQEAFKKAKEAWLATPKRTQAQYESKAARLTNARGLTAVRPPDLGQVTVQPAPRAASTLPNTKTGLELLTNVNPRLAILPNADVGQVPQPISKPGPADTSKITLGPGLTLPSGITVSKVQSDKPISVQNRRPPPGVTMFMNNTPRPVLPPSLPSSVQQVTQMKRRLISPIRPTADVRTANSLRAKAQQNLTRLRRISIRPQFNLQSGTFNPNSLGLGPQLPTPSTSRENAIRFEHKESFVCRLCGDFGPSRWSFITKPDMLVSIKYVFDLNIDVEKEKKYGISNRVCDVCFDIMTSSETLKRKAFKLQEVTDSFIEQHLRAKAKKEPDDDIIFVSEKKIQALEEPLNPSDQGTNPNETDDNHVTGGIESQPNSTSPAGVEKENLDLTFSSNTGGQSLVNGDPETDLKADLDNSIDKVRDANPQETFQNQSQEALPMDAMNDSDLAPFPDFLLSEELNQMEVSTE